MIADTLEELVVSLDPSETSQVQLERLRSGLSLIVEAEKALLAERAERTRARLSWLQGLTPVLITTVITGAAGVFTLLWQSKEHDRDAQAAAQASAASADRNGRDLQASRELEDRLERNKLLRELAPRVVGSAPPRPADCRLALGIWNDYAQGDHAPLLESACAASAADATDAGSPATTQSTGEQPWVAIAATDAERGAGCSEAARAKGVGLDPVRLWGVPGTNEFPTTVGEFQTRMEADAYVQVVRAHWPGARVMRLPRHWKLETCFDKAAGPAN